MNLGTTSHFVSDEGVPSRVFIHNVNIWGATAGKNKRARLTTIYRDLVSHLFMAMQYARGNGVQSSTCRTSRV